MDLIYTNGGKVDYGVLQRYQLDMAFGEDENNFECTVAAADHVCEAGSLLYIYGSEYGGIVDAIGVDTDSQSVIYTGRTWHGILGSKVIVPLTSGDTSSGGVTVKLTDSGGDSLINRYLVISGEANACLRWLINRLGLSDLFSAPSTDSGISITAYQFPRYIDAYTGVCKMLSDVGAKLAVVFRESVVLAAESVAILAYTSDQIAFSASRDYHPCNHLICLGSGELEARTRVDLYIDEDGRIGTAQHFFGLDEIAAVYDYSSAESTDELVSGGLERLAELNGTYADFDFAADDENYDVGDKISVTDELTGIVAEANIKKKIVTLSNGIVTVAYEVGE